MKYLRKQALPTSILVLWGVYFCAGKLALLLASVHPSAAPVWPPTGIAIASLLLYGYRIWPGVFLGAFFVNATTFGSIGTSLGIACGNTLEGLIGAFLVNRLAGGRRAFERPQGIFRFSVSAGAAATSISATVGVTSLSFGGFADWAGFWPVWFTWWLGDMSGALVVAPFLILLLADGGERWGKEKLFEAGGLLVTLFLVILNVFQNWFELLDGRYPLAFLSLPILTWAAVRFGVQMTATAAVLLTGASVWSALQGIGPFSLERFNQSLLLLQLFIGVSTVTALMLAAAVSEQKRAKEALGRNEKHFRALIENSTDVVVLIDREATIQYASPSSSRILGYPAPELVGKNGFEFVHPDDREETRKRLRHLLENPEEIVRAEYRIQHRGGFWLWFESIGSNLLSDPGVGAIVVNLRDSTERRRVEEKFRTTVESSPSGLVMVDQAGKIVLVNTQTERLFGYRREELVGQPVEMLVPARFRAAHPAHRSDFFANPQTRAMGAGRDLYGLRKDGREMPVEIGLNPLKTEEGFFVLATVVDITERKRLEKELRDANEKLSGWVAELEKRNREVFVLNEMGDLLQTCASYDEAYRVIARTALKLFPGESGAVFRLDPQARFLETAAVWGEPLLGERSFDAERCWALRRGKMHVVESERTELVCPHLTRPMWKGSLCVPLVAQSETVGILHLQGGPERKSEEDSQPHWTEAKIQLVRMAAEHMALNLAGLKLRSTLSERSIRDPLTGLFNRRYLEESLERELFRAAREQKTLGAIMIDLDRFKSFNDTFGHPAGDEVLKQIGEFIQSRTRRGDIACRYGGEEFTLILPGASLEISVQRAEKLRQEIQQLKMPHSKHVTISLGVAVFPEHGTTKELLLKAADFALYRAKNEGRNRVVTASLLSAGQVKTL